MVIVPSLETNWLSSKTTQLIFRLSIQSTNSNFSSSVLSFFLSLKDMLTGLSLKSRNIQTQNCAPIQCTFWNRNDPCDTFSFRNGESSYFVWKIWYLRESAYFLKKFRLLNGFSRNFEITHFFSNQKKKIQSIKQLPLA